MSELAEQARVKEVRRIIDDLTEHRKLKYIGDCKCGHCQLVPQILLDDAIIALSALLVLGETKQ